MAYNAAMTTTIEGPAVMMADESVVVDSMETVTMVVVGSMVGVGGEAAGEIILTHNIINQQKC